MARGGRADPGGSSPERLFRDIVQGLYEGRYVPGQRLVEADVAQTYGVSRSTVREALSRLAAERVVELNRHRGAQIRKLSRAETREILALVELLIGLGAKLASAAIDYPGARDRMGAALDHLMSFEARRDSFELLRARNIFYRTMIEVGGNRELARVLPGMHVHLVRVQVRHYVAEAPGERFSDYRAIGAAILEGAPRRAELAGRRHVRCLAGALEKLPDKAFAREAADPEEPTLRNGLRPRESGGHA